MAPKAKAASKAKARAKRGYVLRDQRVRPPPQAVAARTEQLLRDMLAKPGRYFACPLCSYPRYVPNEASCIYSCAMPRVRPPSGRWVKCDYKTTAAAWRRRPQKSAAHEAACKAVVKDIILDVEAQCEAGALRWESYYGEVRRLFATKTAAPQNPNLLAPAEAAQPEAQIDNVA